CFVDTLRSYRPEHTDDDVAQVVISAQRMKLSALGPEVMALFRKLRVHRPASAELARILPDAVVALATADDEAELVRQLTMPMPTSDDPAFSDEVFWETVAARAVGRLRSKQAVAPLIRIFL